MSASLWALLSLGTACSQPATPLGAADAAADAPPPDAPDAVAADAAYAPTLRYSAGPWALGAGAERSTQCESWTLNNDEPLFVNAVEFSATPGMHHSNWFFVPDRNYAGPDGTWPCASRGFDQGIASGLGGVFFAQSTQIREEAQRFPPGAAIVLPPHARIIGALHMLNATGAALSAGIRLTVRTIPRDQVRTRLSPFYLEYQPLDIAARARSQFDVSCDLAPQVRHLTGAPLDMRFFYGIAHYHELGAQMRVTLIGGPHDGEVLYQTDARQGESWARTMDPPVDVSGTTGFRLSCVFDNPRTRAVHYGIGDQEMCIFFGFTDSAYQWASRATDAARPTVVGDVGGVTLNTAPCDQIVSLPSRFVGE